MEEMQLAKLRAYLPKRSRQWHKGLSGHVLVIGGETGYSGAPKMAAEAALRVGAGLVSVATHPDHASMLNLTRPELMCHGIETKEQLQVLMTKANVIVVGPGLGRGLWSKMLWEVVCEANQPLIVDADALNLLAEKPFVNHHWVLTPHPGEAARLLHSTIADVAKDRLQAVANLQARYGGVSVLKGAGTLVLGHDNQPLICNEGNPGMATAGMGDVLSGVIGGIVAQGVSLLPSAALGVLLHAKAGDLAAKEGGERGMIATDLMPYLRRLSNG